MIAEKEILRSFQSLRMTVYLQRLPKIQKYFHKIHIVGKRIVSRDYDCTTNKLLRKTTKKFHEFRQFFSPKILNIYVDEKNICEENTWKLRNYPKPLQTKGEGYYVKFCCVKYIKKSNFFILKYFIKE